MSQRVVVTALLLAGCDRTTRVEGTVDLVGMLTREGISVRSEDGHCDAVTDASGAFGMDCRRGSISADVTLEAVPHFPFTAPVVVPDVESVSVGPWSLIPKPKGHGLWQINPEGVAALTRTYLVRTGDRGQKAYCLDVDSMTEPPSPSLPEVYLIDQQAPPWRLFRLDEEGCAQRWRWHAADWRITASDSPEGSVQQLPNAALHHFTLAAGRYFVADWADERMTPDRAHATATGNKRYLGAVLVVAE